MNFKSMGKMLACGMTAALLSLLIFSSTAKARLSGVSSDIAPLRATLVLSLGEQIFKTSEMGGAGQNRHPIFGGLPRGVIREHQALRDLLRKQNVRVFDVRDLLNGAIQNARREGKLADWLRRTFPAAAEEATQRMETIDADSVLK